MNLKELRQTLEPAMSPYKVVRRDAIQYVGRVDDIERPTNIYRVDGADVMVDEGVSHRLDELIGLEQKQASVVRNASGEDGVRDFRNYLAVAGSISKPVHVALLANSETRMVDGVVPIKEDVIPMDAFFDYLEVFLEVNRLIPVRYEMDNRNSLEVTVYMDSEVTDVRNIGPGEDFLVNSYFLRWTLGQIELGHYFVRLVCTNGQIRTITQGEARIHSLQSDDSLHLLELPQRTNLLDVSFAEFSDKAVEAMRTRASMGELQKVARLLSENFADPRTKYRIAPFEEMRQRYAERGFDTSPRRLKELKSGVNVWDLYNGLTEYATHNTEWKDSDTRRGYLQREAISFLLAKRDIRYYQDIFAGE